MGGEIRETRPYLVYRRFKGSDDIFELFTLHDQLAVTNCRKRVYFEQKMLALLLVCQTHNLTRIKFAHISRQVEGFHMS